MNSPRKKIDPWSLARDEPRLCDLLGDPVLQALMRRDKVSEGELLALAGPARRSLGA